MLHYRAAAIVKCVAADGATQPREWPGDSVNEKTPRDTPYIGIFWLVQTSNVEARLLAVGRPLDQAEPYGDCLTYGPGHYETWAHWPLSEHRDTERDVDKVRLALKEVESTVFIEILAIAEKHGPA